MSTALGIALLEKVNANRATAFFIAVLVLIVGWSAQPMLQPYVRMPGNTLELSFPCVPEEIGINFVSDRIKALRAEITVDSTSATAADFFTLIALAAIYAVITFGSNAGGESFGVGIRQAEGGGLVGTMEANVLYIALEPVGDLVRVTIIAPRCAHPSAALT